MLRLTDSSSSVSVCVGVRALRRTSSKTLAQAEREKRDLACLIPQLSSHWPLTRLMPAAMLFKNDAFPPPTPPLPPHTPPVQVYEREGVSESPEQNWLFSLGLCCLKGGLSDQISFTSVVMELGVFWKASVCSLFQPEALGCARRSSLVFPLDVSVLICGSMEWRWHFTRLKMSPVWADLLSNILHQPALNIKCK